MPSPKHLASQTLLSWYSMVDVVESPGGTEGTATTAGEEWALASGCGPRWARRGLQHRHTTSCSSCSPVMLWGACILRWALFFNELCFKAPSQGFLNPSSFFWIHFGSDLSQMGDIH